MSKHRDIRALLAGAVSKSQERRLRSQLKNRHGDLPDCPECGGWNTEITAIAPSAVTGLVVTTAIMSGRKYE